MARDAGLGRMTWLAGAAELTAPAFWAVGAHGFTSGLANVSPALALGMLGALREQRLPRQRCRRGKPSAGSRNCAWPTAAPTT